MRIVAIPLSTRAPTSSQALMNTILPLTYYHFHTPPPHPDKEPTIFKKATNKAADLWGGFGKSPEGHWKVKSSVKWKATQTSVFFFRGGFSTMVNDSLIE